MLVSMVAWLAFFSGLYFVEAPTRRDGCDVSWMTAEQQSNVTRTSTNDSVSATTVDVRFHGVTQPNTSTPETTYLYVHVDWNWVTVSPGHWVNCDPLCDPEFFNFQFSKNAYMLNLHVKC